MKRETVIDGALRNYRNRPRVDGINVGDIVYGSSGRRFRVLENDGWISYRENFTSGGIKTSEGPYCTLQALDDPSVVVSWRRSWYAKIGETMEMDL